MKGITLSTISLFLCAGLSAQPKYDYSTIQREKLGRGVVCVRENDSVAISWRFLSTDDEKTTFNVYADGKKLNASPLISSTFFKHPAKDKTTKYSVVPVIDGKETKEDKADYTLFKKSDKPYISIPLNRPADMMIDGIMRQYSANDASVGDVDGDGEYEIILKWDCMGHDNSHEGVTGNVLLDCYKLNGKQLWRIDLGRNIRAGAHYTQFMVFDFDGDGKAELMTKTADGTVDGTGKYIGDKDANYVTNGIIDKSINGKMNPHRQRVSGRILSGPEYLTVFDGETGAALKTVDYIPSRGDVSSWGDSYGNRVDRFLACVAYLDGKHPSAVFCRGYYTRTVIAAWDWDGKELTSRWVFDSEKTDSINRIVNPDALPYSGQGNHNLRVGDVDGDGCDEITYGSMAINNDGTGLYTTGMGHGDAIHLMAFYPDSSSLQIWDVHENKRDGSDFRDARTGRIIFQIKDNSDVGRGMAADIDPTNPGLEMWSSSQRGYFDVNGNHHNTNTFIPQNSAVWWDGDKLRELLDREAITKFNWNTAKCDVIKNFRTDGCAFNNDSKMNPCLSADIIGDWREEVIVRTRDSKELRVYTTTIPTTYRFHSFMEDIPYRISVATENVGYNQPPEPSFYFGVTNKE